MFSSQFKINEAGLISGDLPTGTWGMGELVADNSSWTVNIPSSLAPGQYFLRHEVSTRFVPRKLRWGGATNCCHPKFSSSRSTRRTSHSSTLSARS